MLLQRNGMSPLPVSQRSFRYEMDFNFSGF